MYHVVLDTDVLRQDPQRRGIAFRRLLQLIAEGHVRLHLPEIGRREFLTAMAAESKKSIRDAERNLKDVPVDFLTGVAVALRERLHDLRQTIGEQWQAEFDSWCSRANVCLLPLPDGCMEAVMDAYFEGRPPFRSPKSRTDFPDALIWASVLDLAARAGSVCFIVRDERFRAAVTTESHVIGYASIGDFLLATYDELAAQIDTRMFAMLLDHVSFIESRIARDLTDEIAPEVEDIPKFGDDTRRTVESLDTHDVAVKMANAENLGGGFFRFPFRARATATVVILPPAGKTYTGYADQDGPDPIGNQWDEEVNVSGVMNVHVDHPEKQAPYLNNEDLRRVMLSADFEIVDMEVTFSYDDDR
jgi:hypothetical protein